MKKILGIISIIIVFLLGIIVCYAESINQEQNNGYTSLVNTFENLDSNFKFYNLKSNAI